jgi:hypothetical protein
MSLVAYYKFEDSPGFLNDSSGNGKNLTNVNVNQTSFIKSKCADYGTSQITGTCLYSAGFGYSRTQSLTLMCLLKINQEIASGLYGIMNYTFTTGSFDIQYEYNSGTRRVQALANFSGNARAYYNITLGTNNIYHIAATYSNNNYIYLYLNGTKVAEVTGFSLPNTSRAGEYYSIGSTYWGSASISHIPKAKYDEFRVYNEILTGTKIKQIYSQLKGIF